MSEEAGTGEGTQELQTGRQRLVRLLDSAIVILMVLILLVMSWPISLTFLSETPPTNKIPSPTPSAPGAIRPT